MQGHDIILMDETGSGKWLVTSQPSTSIDPSTVVRVIARPNTTPQIFAQIRNNPPRILVSTPGALVDAMTSGQLQLKTTLRRIIVDELRNYHTPEAAQAIDKLLRLMWEGRRPKPQMVMMSATLTLHVRSWLFKQNGWMSERVVRIHGIQEKIDGGRADGRLRNLNEEDQEADSSSEEGERGILSGDPEAILGLLDREGDGATLGSRPGPTYQLPTRLAKGITLPPSILEAVATSVALDVSHRALLVIPNGVSIGPVVEALRELGVEARTLNLKDEIEHVSNRLENEQEVHSKPSSATTSSDRSLAEDEGEDFVSNPTLLVATTTAVRGIDIPTLSHVYIVGGLESEEIYRHVAGRAGRFGMPGTVISFVGADEAEKLVGGTGERRIRKIFERIGVSNVPFPHI
ncbi:helicase superfamily c-terminal domain [Rhizoctonia solani]|uniref:RNA helicase n=1 Tax=Rhizoctonia solani TaxID=456999 RepID=A0A8H7M4L0_9AGAM|nr:helicase superfamily c-terminal domain [Rhizoctonia solani]